MKRLKDKKALTFKNNTDYYEWMDLDIDNYSIQERVCKYENALEHENFNTFLS